MWAFRTIRPLRQRRAYLSSEAPSFLDPLSGLGFLLFYLEPQKFILLPSFFVVTIKDVLDLSAMLIENKKIKAQRLSP